MLARMNLLRVEAGFWEVIGNGPGLKGTGFGVNNTLSGVDDALEAGRYARQAIHCLGGYKPDGGKLEGAPRSRYGVECNYRGIVVAAGAFQTLPGVCYDAAGAAGGSDRSAKANAPRHFCVTPRQEELSFLQLGQHNPSAMANLIAK
jgi:hypothetical protein